MSDLVPLAARTAFHYARGYGYGQGGGMTDWISHMVLSSVVHALVYGLVFRLLHRLTLGEDAVLVGVVLVGLMLWSRGRERRGW